MNDVDRMDWLSAPGRFCMTQDRDQVMSMHFERKAVGFYINGKYTVANGDNLRAAIDAAIAQAAVARVIPE